MKGRVLVAPLRTCLYKLHLIIAFSCQQDTKLCKDCIPFIQSSLYIWAHKDLTFMWLSAPWKKGVLATWWMSQLQAPHFVLETTVRKPRWCSIMIVHSSFHFRRWSRFLIPGFYQDFLCDTGRGAIQSINLAHGQCWSKWVLPISFMPSECRATLYPLDFKIGSLMLTKDQLNMNLMQYNLLHMQQNCANKML